MAQFNLYVDVVSNSLVTSDQDSTPASLPPLVEGDTPTFNIYLLARSATYNTGVSPFTIISTSGLSLQVVIGDKRGDVNNFYTNQFTWTPDPTSKFFSATLPLNTTAISTAIGTGLSMSAWFEVKYFQGAVPTTVLEIPCNIQAAVNKGGSTGPLPPGLTPLSAEQALSLFLTHTIQGTIWLVSPDGTKKTALWTDNDGSFHQDEST